MTRVSTRRIVRLAAAAAALVFAGPGPAAAQGLFSGAPSSVYNFPVGGSVRDLLSWQAGFNHWLGQVRDLSSLGLPSPGSGGLGTTGTILDQARTLSRHLGKFTNLRTLGDPRAEAEIEALLRRYRHTERLDRGRVAEMQVRNSVQQSELRAYYDRVASQARSDYHGSLAAARDAALRGDYDQALLYTRLATYHAQTYEQYRR